MTQQKTAILILGPHRSGTSAISGAISRFTEANFGKLLMQAQHDNQKGFYENEKIVALNDAILAELYRSWEDPRPLDTNLLKSTRIDYLRERANGVIKEQYNKSEVIAIKDPRLCLTFPFWEAILEEAGFDLKIVVLHRRVEAIVDSLQSREWLSQEHGYLLTTMYALQAERYTRRHNRIWIDYNRAISDTDYLNNRLPTLLSDLILTLNVSNELDPRLQNFGKSASSESSIDSQYIALYEALGEFEKASDGEILQPDVAVLEKAFSTYNQIAQEKGASLLRSRADHGKVIFKYVNQLDKVVHSYRLEDEGVSIEIGWTAENRPDKILIIPIHRSATLTDLHVELIGEETYQISHSSTWQNHNIIGFEDSQPRIIINLERQQKFAESSCRISYTYQNYKSTSQKRKSIYDLSISALTTFLKRPRKAFRVINKENWRTLRSALKRESPRQIIRNFTRLMNREDSEGDIAIEKLPIAHIHDRKYRKKIIYVSPTIPKYDQSSGERRADHILKILGRLSQVYCKVRKTSDRVYVDRLTDYGVHVITDHEKRWMKELGKVDVIIYDKYYTYWDESRLRNHFPDAQHVIDSVDVHWVRELRGLDSDQNYDKSRVQKNKSRELGAYKKADEIWVVSEPDALAIQKEGISVDVIKIVSNIHSIHINQYISRNKSVLFFLGNYNHEPNIWTANWIASEIFPIIRKSIPHAQLWIAGAAVTPAILDLQEYDGVSVLGYLKEDELAQIYCDTSLVLAPLVAGAGVKGKLLEAISYRTPLLTNNIGNEGINIQHGKEGFIANDKNIIAATVISVLNNEFDLEEITQNAQNQILGRFTYEIAQTSIELSLYPPVDICIVTYNRIELLRSCISSIMQHTDHPNYRIRVYSNACTDGTRSYLEELEKNYSNILAIYSETNDVFVKPNNKLMGSSNHDVVLLNNDTEVTPGWLMGLQTIAHREKDIGIVGPMLTYADGTVQELGSEVFPDGTGMNYFNNYRLNDIDVRQPHAVPYVSGCAMFIKRSTLEKLGLFDASFDPCYFEDSDLCYRAWEGKLKVVVVPEITVTHHGGSTAGVDTEQGYKSFQIKNAQSFLKKHKSQLKVVKSQCKAINKTLSLT